MQPHVKINVKAKYVGTEYLLIKVLIVVMIFSLFFLPKMLCIQDNEKSPQTHQRFGEIWYWSREQI